MHVVKEKVALGGDSPNPQLLSLVLQLGPKIRQPRVHCVDRIDPKLYMCNTCALLNVRRLESAVDIHGQEQPCAETRFESRPDLTAGTARLPKFVGHA